MEGLAAFNAISHAGGREGGLKRTAEKWERCGGGVLGEAGLRDSAPRGARPNRTEPCGAVPSLPAAAAAPERGGRADRARLASALEGGGGSGAGGRGLF